MQLSKRNSDLPQKKEQEPVDWSIFEVDYQAVIPYGKQQGMTLEWVKKNDDNYYRWMFKEDMIEKWGLYKVKGRTARKKTKEKLWNPWYNADTGETYMGYREINTKTLPVDESW